MDNVIIVAVYLIPWLVSEYMGHKDNVSIFALNLLLGWTVIGWAIALIWALKTQE